MHSAYLAFLPSGYQDYSRTVASLYPHTPVLVDIDVAVKTETEPGLPGGPPRSNGTKQPRKLTKEAYAILSDYFYNVTDSPDKKARAALVDKINSLPGCAHYTSTQAYNYFYTKRQTMKHRLKQTSHPSTHRTAAPDTKPNIVVVKEESDCQIISFAGSPSLLHPQTPEPPPLSLPTPYPHTAALVYPSPPSSPHIKREAQEPALGIQKACLVERKALFDPHALATYLHIALAQRAPQANAGDTPKTFEELTEWLRRCSSASIAVLGDFAKGTYAHLDLVSHF